MSCCKTEILPPEEQFGVLVSTPCASITVDLLQVYKRGIDCYLQYRIWDKIGSNEAELLGAQEYLQDFINQKITDPNDCTGIEFLYLVRVLVDKIIKVGACL